MSSEKTPRRQGRRALSVFMAVVLVLGLCPASALADGSGGSSSGTGNHDNARLVSGSSSDSGNQLKKADSSADGMQVLTIGQSEEGSQQNSVLAPQATTKVVASGTSGTCSWSVDSNGLLTIKPANGKSGTLAEPDMKGSRAFPWVGTWNSWYLKEIEVYEGYDEDDGDMYYTEKRYATKTAYDITSVKVEPGVKAGKSARRMFSYMRLDSLNVKNLDTSATQDMREMFQGTCVEKEVDLSFSTVNVTNMSAMFRKATFDWHEDGTWNTSKVKNTSWMFADDNFARYKENWDWPCPDFIRVSGFGNVTDASHMFEQNGFGDGAYIRELNLAGFDNRKANCADMFKGVHVTSLKVGKLFSFDKTDMSLAKINDNYGYEGKLWSVNDQRWYTEAQLKSSRSFIRDTYCSEQATNIAKATVTGISDKTYTGKEIKPKPVVTFNGKKLVEGEDYTLSYENNVKAGTASVIISGRFEYAEGYTGDKTVTFKILPASLKAKATGASATVSATAVYTGKQLTPKQIVVKALGKTLKKGTDYTVSYQDAKGQALKASLVKNVATYRVLIKGIGSFKETIVKNYKISKAANPMAVKATAKTVKLANVKKKAQAVAPISFPKKAQGKVTYAKASGAKCLTVNKSTGKVTVKKGTKKGAYTAKVKVTAAGNANYKAASKTVTVKVVVK